MMHTEMPCRKVPTICNVMGFMVLVGAGIAILRSHNAVDTLTCADRVRRDTAVAARSCPGLGSYGDGMVPPACWHPYDTSSPFNTRIGPNPKVHPESAAIVARLIGFGAGPDNLVANVTGTDADWGHPTYYSRPEDPIFEIHCSVYACPDIEGASVAIPEQAQPAAGSDHHMTVVDQSTGVEYDFWDVTQKPAGGGQLICGGGGRTDVNGTGLGSGATAAGFGNLAGIIRAPELVAGSIDHALFMVVRCTSGESQYPAGKGVGLPCSQLNPPLPTQNAPELGMLFQLALTDAQIQALNLPTWQATIVTAMAHYGMYVGDTGGGTWGVQLESGATYTSFGVADPLVAFAEAEYTAGASGVGPWNSQWVFRLADTIDWSQYLRVVVIQ